MRKLMSVLLASALILTASLVSAASEDIKEGQIVGYKNDIGIYYVEFDNERTLYGMTLDMQRVEQRLKNLNANSAKKFGPTTIWGYRTPDGMYHIFMQTFFFQTKIAVWPWEKVQEALTKQGNAIASKMTIQPNQFQTFWGFEDIWCYFDWHEDDFPAVLRWINAMNTELIQSEEVR